MLAAATGYGTVRLWNAAAPDPRPEEVVLNEPAGFMFSLSFDPACGRDRCLLAAASEDGTVRLWDAAAPDPSAEVAVLDGGVGAISELAFSPACSADGQATGKTCRRWLAILGDAGMSLRELAHAGLPADPIPLASSGGITSIGFSPDGRWLAAGNIDNAAQVWDLRDPAAEPILLRGHLAGVTAVAFARGGEALITASADTTIRVWDLRAADPSADPHVLRGHTGAVEAIALDAAGTRLASGSTDGTVRVWDLAFGSQNPAGYAIPTDPRAYSTLLRGHSGPVRWVTFLDERPGSIPGRVASAGDDGTVRLWILGGVHAGDSVVLRGPEEAKHGAMTSRDGRWVVVSSVGEVRLWHLRLDELRDLACLTAARNLSDTEWKLTFAGEDSRPTCAGLPIHESVVQAHLDEGKASARSGDPARAADEYRQALELDPGLRLDPAEEIRAATTNKLGFFIGTPAVPLLSEVIRDVRPPLIVVANPDPMFLRSIRNDLSPDSFVVGRLFVDWPQQAAWLDGDDPEAGGRELAERILEWNGKLATERGANGRFLVDAWSGLNEPMRGPASYPGLEVDEEFRRRAAALDRFQVAFRQRLQAEGLEVVAFNFGAGNFMRPEDYLDYFPRTLDSYTYLGFHEYGWPSLQPDPTLGTRTSALSYHTVMEGIRARYGDRHRAIVTELGLARAYKYPSGEDVGWLNKAEPISQDQYWNSLDWYNTAMARDNYALGAALFDVGAGPKWETFRHLGVDNDGQPLTIISRIAGIQPR
jgi:WD40 repeat protein